MPARRLRMLLGSFALCVLLSSLGIVVALGAEPEGASGPAPTISALRYEAGEVIVRPRGGIGAQSLVAAFGDGQVSVLGHVPELRLERLQVPPGKEWETIQALRQSGLVEYAEPNYIYRTQVQPGDEFFVSRQWNLRALRLPEAWEITTGASDVTVAIVDSGIDRAHPDLVGKVWADPSRLPFQPHEGDDWGTYPHDAFGWNFVANNNLPDEDTAESHGTHIAGIIGAAANNGRGVAGVSWGARLMAVKVVNQYGDTGLWEVVRGIVYAANRGARIINLSLGAGGGPQGLEDAVNYAYQRGVLVVAAAGNTGVEEAANGGEDWIYPAAFPNVLSVAATTMQDQWAWFSTYNRYVDVAAPGYVIYSTVRDNDTGGHVYRYQAGTSQAAPHVAGLAALIWSVNPQLTPDQVREIIQSTARDVNAGTHPGKDFYLGDGLVDAAAALRKTPHLLRVGPTQLEFTVGVQGSSPIQYLANPATGPSTWRAESAVPWLVAGDPEGGTPSRLPVRVNPAALPDTGFGTFETTLRVHSTMAQAVNSPQEVRVVVRRLGPQSVSFPVVFKAGAAGW